MNLDTTSTDTTSTDTTSTDTTSTDTPVTVTEIAEFLRELRVLSQSLATIGGGLGRDRTAERAALLARKADLLARIAATPADLIPPTPAPPTARHGDGSS
ncbi:MAG: hypothetical protein JOY78_08955 [Pseudonocardia sp.]|nr:hypothetical protein [Pseudonocardia sp.]